MKLKQCPFCGSDAIVIKLDNAIEAIASRDETDGTCNVFSGKQVIDILKDLPSAEPDLQPTCNNLATDSISRQAAIDAVEFGITYAKAINKSTGEVKELFKEGNKALNEAVERLKELPSAEPKTPSNGSITSINPENTHDRTMGDLISRQDAKDAIDMALDHIDHVPPWVYDKLLNVLNEVPSAEKAQLSEEDATKDATSDLISRQVAIDAVNKIAPVNTEYDCTLLDILDVRYVLTELPSAEPEIIRCKDCKYWEGEEREGFYYFEHCQRTGLDALCDDFCSRAERREE